jgi:peptide deformylase
MVEEEVDPGVVVGTNLRIVKYPHPALRAPNVEITPEELSMTSTTTPPSSNDNDDNSQRQEPLSIAQLAKEMFMVMYAANGVGLAAPQVGVNKRLMVYNPSGDKTKWLEEVIMINPTITEFSTATDVDVEGCLSFPNMKGDVSRAKWIKVEAISLRGKKIKKKYTGWEARIFQHEYDHLDGVVYIDRLVEESKLAVRDRLSELVQEYNRDQPGGGPPAL